MHGSPRLRVRSCARTGRATDRSRRTIGSPLAMFRRRARLAGVIHFCFACYSAGCPREDNFARTEAGPRPIAEHPMIARLPQAMLAHPGGSALASLGHIDRAWAYSFVSDRGKGQVQGIRDVLARILSGDRIGHATDQFNVRWAALSTDLTESLQAAAKGNNVSDAVLANRWIARDDARNYIILGDPAIRLRVNDMPAARRPDLLLSA